MFSLTGHEVKRKQASGDKVEILFVSEKKREKTCCNAKVIAVCARLPAFVNKKIKLPCCTFFSFSLDYLVTIMYLHNISVVNSWITQESASTYFHWSTIVQ